MGPSSARTRLAEEDPDADEANEFGGAIGLAKQVITSLQIGVFIGFCPLSTPEWAVHHNREEVARLAGYKSGLSGHSDSSRVKTIRSCSGDVL